jgi:hypothetical protein
VALGDPHLARCPGCDAEVPSRVLGVHVCDWSRWLDHQVDLRSDELQRFERELGAYLDSPRGRFDLWCAERERSRRFRDDPAPT